MAKWGQYEHYSFPELEDLLVLFMGFSTWILAST